jgi:hypothetical protein
MTHRDEQSMRRRIKSTQIADSARRCDIQTLVLCRAHISQFGASSAPAAIGT